MGGGAVSASVSTPESLEATADIIVRANISPPPSTAASLCRTLAFALREIDALKRKVEGFENRIGMAPL